MQAAAASETLRRGRGPENLGVQHARGAILFFTDADCLLQDDTLSLAVATLAAEGPGYRGRNLYSGALRPALCSRFRSVFIRYFETRHGAGGRLHRYHALP